MNWRTVICCLSLVGALSVWSSSANAQVVVLGGVPSYGYGTTVVVGRPVIPAVSVVPAPVVAAPVVASSYYAPSYSASYGVYSTYRPVVPSAYVAPVVRYPAYVPVRPGVVSSRVYVPGQPVRNTLRVLAP